DLADLLLVRLGRALLDARGFLQQRSGRRSLGDEGKSPILEDRDLDRDHLARQRSGAVVVGLDELHDVDAVRAERGTDRRRGRGLPRLHLDLDDGLDFLLCHYFKRSTWRRSSSTGVSRPNMLTSTLSLPLSALISSTLPWKSENGPSMTRT